MDLDALRSFFHEVAADVSDGDGGWQFEIDNVRLACLADLRFDRMRLIAPVLETDVLTDEQRDSCLEANFHTALDARYATSDGILYAAFIHPLQSLTQGDLRNAMDQVVSLVQTFGSTYSSGALVFGVPPSGGDAPN
ncbi:MAG: hypothetical protein JKY37_01320 [Nannocystaceae bacterium]|nr:hypothetical protein [Nannocystaceae bacterium]